MAGRDALLPLPCLARHEDLDAADGPSRWSGDAGRHASDSRSSCRPSQKRAASPCPETVARKREYLFLYAAHARCLTCLVFSPASLTKVPENGLEVRRIVQSSTTSWMLFSVGTACDRAGGRQDEGRGPRATRSKSVQHDWGVALGVRRVWHRKDGAGGCFRSAVA